ncbi:accessory gene regulator B family protein [Lachnospiraceae bacterium 54-53]
MTRRISAYIVAWQIKKNILTNNQRAVYLYAYEVLINQIINVMAALLIAVIMRAPIPVFIFIASYIPLRSYCGGYHAETNGGCTVVSALLIVLVCLIEKTITGNFVFVLVPISLAISGGLIFRFAPVSAISKPLDEEETVRFRKRSRQIWQAEAVVEVLFCFIWTRVSVVIALSHIFLSIMLIYGMVKKQRQ